MTNLIPGVYLVAGPCSRPKLNDDISGEEAESSVEEEKEKEEDALRKKSLLAALDAKWAAENSQDGTAIPIKTLLNFIHMHYFMATMSIFTQFYPFTMAGGAKPTEASSTSSSWFSYGTAIVANILENIQLDIRDIHIRYEGRLPPLWPTLVIEQFPRI